MDQQLSSDAVELLKEMIAIPSFSREEGGVADMLEHYIELRGYVAARKGNNIWLTSPGFDLSKPTILLNSHIDTVKPASSWKRDPFTPTSEDDKLFGLGSNDAGASVVSLLHTFFHLTSTHQSYNLIFAASAEEEVSGSNGIESLLKELPKIDFAIVGEPTNMNMAVAEKGLMVVDCTATGVSGHAARDEGYNAIYKALNDLEWFRTYQFPKQSNLLGAVKMSVTQINAGTQHNVVPDKCTFVVDIRSNELYSNQEILDIIRQHTCVAVEPRSTRLSSTATPLDHPIVTRGHKLQRTIYGSPTLSDQALLSCPSIKIGPGDSSRSHTAEEYILESEIAHAIELYIRLLDGIEL